MARLLSNVGMRKPHLPSAAACSTLNLIVAFMGILSVFSIVTFLCSSHTRGAKKEKRTSTSTVQLGERKPRLSMLGSSLSNKALLMAKMVSWRKVHGEAGSGGVNKEGGSADGNEDAVWKRTIIMGERCQPVDFSGRILYDSQGNLLPEAPPSKSKRGTNN